MRKNEPDPTQRVAGPIPFYDADGKLKSGLTFTGAGETAIFNLTTGTFADTATAAVEAASSGMYYVQLQQAETNFGSFLIVRLRKAGYDDEFFIVPIDNTPDVNVVSMSADSISAAAVSAGAASKVGAAILDELLSNHSVIGSVADGIAIAAGLLQGNFMMDNVDNTNVNGQTAARMRVWRSAAAMSGATAGGAGLQGAFASFDVTTTYEGPSKVTMHKTVRTA